MRETKLENDLHVYGNVVHSTIQAGHMAPVKDNTFSFKANNNDNIKEEKKKQNKKCFDISSNSDDIR